MNPLTPAPGPRASALDASSPSKRARALHQLPRPLRETTLPITSCGERDDLVASNNTHHIACIVVMDLSRRDRDDGSARISTVGAGHRGNSMYGEARMDTHAQKRTWAHVHASAHRYIDPHNCTSALRAFPPGFLHTYTRARKHARARSRPSVSTSYQPTTTHPSTPRPTRIPTPDADLGGRG